MCTQGLLTVHVATKCTRKKKVQHFLIPYYLLVFFVKLVVAITIIQLLHFEQCLHNMINVPF